MDALWKCHTLSMEEGAVDVQVHNKNKARDKGALLRKV
jgi:hypothetical protein